MPCGASAWSRFGSESMPTLLRPGGVAEDDWELLAAGEAAPGLIVPLAAWRKAPDGAGVWVEGDAEIDEIGDEIRAAPVVAVRFAAFADGRGLSFASLLRGRHGYRGELRAFGEIVPDLTPYMLRCGFDAFLLATSREAEVALACITRSRHHYQASATEPTPRFRQPVAD